MLTNAESGSEKKERRERDVYWHGMRDGIIFERYILRYLLSSDSIKRIFCIFVKTFQTIYAIFRYWAENGFWAECIFC